MEKRSRSHDEEQKSAIPGLIQCAELILPWLHPIELGSISATCKTLYQISQVITSRRISDASRTFENLPIPFINNVDHQLYSYFIYTPSQIIGLATEPSPNFRQHWGSKPGTRPIYCVDQPEPIDVRVEGAYGCRCHERGCDADSGCPCFSGLDLDELSRECGPSCGCGPDCGNRLTQRGVTMRLKIVKGKRKGWGLHAGQLIREGQFVCEFAGELLTTKEARMRQKIYDLASCDRFCSALLVVKEHLPSGNACMRINIDATKIGNVARFINHSCEGGNLSTMLVRNSGAFLPRLCFIASRDIQDDEELTFSYGDIRLRQKGLQCFCNSSRCYGILPSENT